MNTGAERQLDIIGRVERVAFPGIHIDNIPAKIDTGADTSSIWASQAIVKDDGLHVTFLAQNSPHYTAETHVFTKGEYSLTRVANSFGHREIRYKVKMRIIIGGRTIRATFTLADRSNKLYPVLIGRKLLANKFLVDVSKGNPLKEQENRRAKKLTEELKLLGDNHENSDLI